METDHSQTIEDLWEHESQYMTINEVLRLAKQAYSFRLGLMDDDTFNNYVINVVGYER